MRPWEAADAVLHDADYLVFEKTLDVADETLHARGNETPIQDQTKPSS
jgi:hypothetical protein